MPSLGFSKNIFNFKVKSEKKCEESVKDRCDQIITRLDGMNKDEMAGVLKVEINLNKC